MSSIAEEVNWLADKVVESKKVQESCSNDPDSNVCKSAVSKMSWPWLKVMWKQLFGWVIESPSQYTYSPAVEKAAMDKVKAKYGKSDS